MALSKGDSTRKRKGNKVDNVSKAVENKEGNSSSSSKPVTQSRIKEQTWCDRCLGVTKYMLLFIVIPPFLNYAALNMEQRQLQEPGTLYDVGFGQKLFFVCAGYGSPTVLLDAPTGMSSDVWSLVTRDLAKITRVCVYDRAGLGFSDRPYRNASGLEPEDDGENVNRWQDFTVEKMADDVHRLITFSSQQVNKPFIYVGSELGALVARFYAQMYDGEVSDVVLIDPLVEGLFDLDDNIWEQFWYGQLVPSGQTMQMAAAAGFTRFALMLGLVQNPLDTPEMDTNATMKQKHLMCNPKHLSSFVDEHHFMNESFSQMRTVFQLKQFPSNTSVTVITGNYYDEQLPGSLNKAWAKSTQHLLTHLHPASKHLLVNGADHNMIYRQPQSVAQPIRRLVRQWRARGDRS